MLGSTKHNLYHWLACPFRMVAIRKCMGSGPVRILDVGCGNHSPRITRTYIPHCTYHGVQKSRWNLDAADDAVIDRLFTIDLDDADALGAIPDSAYDVVICSHILEHLADPVAVVALLATKIAPGGMLYVETPSPRSLRLPRCSGGWMGIRGCLNFHDDETHRAVVDLDAVSDVLTAERVRVTPPRYCRLWRKILLLPFYMAATRVTKGFIPASVLWDATGFAQYVVLSKV